jgi:hypothetical protein
MDFETQSRVQDELLRVQIVAEEADEDGRTVQTANVAVRMEELVFLRHNVIRWSGPGFQKAKTNRRGEPIFRDGEPVVEDVPVTKAAIGQLDPNNAHVRATVERIRRNNSRAAALERGELSPQEAALEDAKNPDARPIPDGGDI